MAMPQPKTLEEVLHTWRQQRESYPNWVVAPRGSRERLWQSLRLEEFGLRFLSATEPVAAPLDLLFAYELNWRLERSLCPLLNDLVPQYERILGRYNPYPQALVGDQRPIRPDDGRYASLAWKELAAQWLDLNLSLLRFNREEGLAERWKETDAQIEAVRERLAPEQVARWSYERCLGAIFELDAAATEEEIRRWPPNSGLPFWEAKRAGLLAELGDNAGAEALLEEALAAIRSSQQSAAVVGDLAWVSQEGHVMHLLHLVKTARQFAERSQATDEKARQEFQQRWNELKQFRCDPWNDLELFDAYLKLPSVGPDTVTRTKEFDIGKESVTHHMGASEDGPKLGYSFLRYCEEVGLPFAVSSLNIAKSQARGAAVRIAESSPEWAFVTMVRIGDAKVARSFFTRDDLAAMEVARVDQHVGRFVGVLRRTSSPLPPDGRSRSGAFSIRIGHVGPEILSRLCTKCSPRRIDEMLSLLRDLYDSAGVDSYDGVDQLVQRLLGSMSARHLSERLPELLEFPVLRQGDRRTLDAFPEPFLSVRRPRRGPWGKDNAWVDPKVVGGLLAKISSGDAEERKRACSRVQTLLEVGLLDEGQSAAFGRGLWGRVGQDGFPVHTPFYTWVFLKLPTPAGIDPVGLFRTYVNTFSLSDIDAPAGGVRVEQAGRVPVNITAGEIPFFRDLLRASKREDGSGFIDWSTEEAVVLLEKLVGWWDAGKDRLRETGPRSPFGDIPGEFRARYRKLVLVLAGVIAPRLTERMDSGAKGLLARLLEELDAYGQPTLRAHVACIPVFPDGSGTVLARVEAAMVTSDAGSVRDALEAVHDLTLMERMRAETEVQRLVSHIGQQIKWRRGVALEQCMDAMCSVAQGAPERLTDDVETDVLAGLEQLRHESDSQAAGPYGDIGDRLMRRERAAALARSMFDKCVNAGAQPSAVLLEWQRICVNPEEFAEIRNQWER
jgi:hypothetical protein